MAVSEDIKISPDYEDAFAALYPPDVAQVRRARALAMRDLRAELRALGSTQQQIADRLGIKQPRLNKILRGDVAAVSMDNLVQLAFRAGLRAEVVFTRCSQRGELQNEAALALAQADRHCDLEGLPPPSKLARKLDKDLAAGRLSSDQAAGTLVRHHKRGNMPPKA